MKTRRTASLWFLVVTIGLGGCGSTGSRSTGPPPSPSISISPFSAVAGSTDLTLTVTAIGGLTFFSEAHNKSDIVWSVNGSDTLLTTTFVNSTKLTAVIPADLLANPVTANVAVETGDPIGSEPLSKSPSATFDVVAVTSSTQLLISSISPTSATVGSSDVTLTILGSGFASNTGCTKNCHPGAVWSVNGSQNSLTITSGNDSELIVVIPAALLTRPVTAEISIQIWHHADSFPIAMSNSVAFNVTSP